MTAILAIANINALVYALTHYRNTLAPNITLVVAFLAIFITIAINLASAKNRYTLFFNITYSINVNRAP